MKKLLTILLVLVCSVGWCAGTTTEMSGKSTIQTGPASFTNFVQLGELATPLKCKIVTGVASNSSSTTLYAHGVGDKVVSVDSQVNFSGTAWVPAGFNDASYYYTIYWDQTNMVVVLGPTATAITAKPIRFVVWYTP